MAVKMSDTSTKPRRSSSLQDFCHQRHGRVHLEQRHRVDGSRVEPRLEVHVAAGGVACGPRVGDQLAAADLLAFGNDHARVVVVDRGQRVAADDAVEAAE